MDDRIRSLFNLHNGKRVYQIKEGEVARAEFEYCAILNQVLFGDKGLVDTLGPTWEMVHDPRFEALEKLFIINKKSFFGGDAREGIQYQTADGTFTGSFAGIEQYAEILGEGRNVIKLLQCRAIIDHVAKNFPTRAFHIDPRDPFKGETLLQPFSPKIRAMMINRLAGETQFSADQLVNSTDEELTSSYTGAFGFEDFTRMGVLSPSEKAIVVEAVAKDPTTDPHKVKDWTDEETWQFLREEYTNYFNYRKDWEPNQVAKTLFALLRADLVGLVADYAEIAKIQETVLLDDPNELYDPELHGEDAYRVWAEVELLERALSYRAELRVTATRVVAQLGLTDRIVELTDFERDRLLQMIYSSKWPDEQTQMLSNILGFLAGIQLTGQTLAEREAQQIATASARAKEYVAGLKSGSIQPINRHTEEVVDLDKTMQDRMQAIALHNPVALALLLRMTDLEARAKAAEHEFYTAHSPVPVDYRRLLVRQRQAVADEPTTCIDLGLQLPEDMRTKLETVDNLYRAVGILKPIFEDDNFKFTDEIADALLEKVDALDPLPTIAPEEVVQYEGEYHPGMLPKPGDLNAAQAPETGNDN